MHNDNERPSFPDDALTADDRKALRDVRPGLSYYPSTVDHYKRSRAIAEETQRRQLERLRRRWINGFVWGLALGGMTVGVMGIAGFALYGAA